MNFVDIWQADLDLDRIYLQDLLSLLDRHEHIKAGKFKIPMLRDRYIAVRGLLRRVLADYLAVVAGDLCFVRGEFGKPALLDHALHFNISHSENKLVIAVSNMQLIGIDIERIKPRDNLKDLAQRCFSAQEFHAWNLLPKERHLQLFYQAWVRKEAFMKAVGRGLALGLEKCELDLSLDLSLLKIPEEYGLASDWKFIELSMESCFCGVFAVENKKFALNKGRVSSDLNSLMTMQAINE